MNDPILQALESNVAEQEEKIVNNIEEQPTIENYSAVEPVEESTVPDIELPDLTVAHEGENDEDLEPEVAPTNNDAWAKKRIEAREAKREAERAKQEADQLKQAMANLGVNQQQMAQLLLQQQQSQQGVQNPEQGDIAPDMTLEPERWQEWFSKKQNSKLEKLEQENQQMQQLLLDQQKRSLLREIENEFTDEVPDYSDAKKHWSKEYKKALKVMYPAATNIQLNQAVQQHEIDYATKEYTNGRDPAEFFYREAVRLGFQGRPDGDISNAEQDIQIKRPNMEKLGQVKQRTKGTIGGGQANTKKIKLKITDFNQLANMGSQQLDEYFFGDN